MKRITERNQIVIDLVKEGKTYKEVGIECGITAQRVQQIYAKCHVMEAYDNTENDIEKILLGCLNSSNYRYHIREGFDKLGIDTIEKLLNTPVDDLIKVISCEKWDYSIGMTVIDEDSYRKNIEKCYRKAKKIYKEKGLSM